MPSTLLSFGILIGKTLFQIPSLAKEKARKRLEKMSIGLVEQEAKEDTDLQNRVSISAAISEISSRGVAIGFSSGIIALCILLIPVTLWNGDLLILRWSIGASGVLWAIFTLRT